MPAVSKVSWPPVETRADERSGPGAPAASAVTMNSCYTSRCARRLAFGWPPPRGRPRSRHPLAGASSWPRPSRAWRAAANCSAPTCWVTTSHFNGTAWVACEPPAACCWAQTPDPHIAGHELGAGPLDDWQPPRGLGESLVAGARQHPYLSGPWLFAPLPQQRLRLQRRSGDDLRPGTNLRLGQSTRPSAGRRRARPALSNPAADRVCPTAIERRATLGSRIIPHPHLHRSTMSDVQQRIDDLPSPTGSCSS